MNGIVGVPQGSECVPVLLLIFINDIEQWAVSSAQLTLFNDKKYPFNYSKTQATQNKGTRAISDIKLLV